MLPEPIFQRIGVEAERPFGQVLALPGLDGGPQGVPASGEHRQPERDPEEDQARQGAGAARTHEGAIADVARHGLAYLTWGRNAPQDLSRNSV